MRRALVVGIDFYTHHHPLYGCVNDAHAVKAVLERHSDGTRNFDVLLLTGTGLSHMVTRRALRDSVESLFHGDDVEIALLYFAGHGHVEPVGGYIFAGDSTHGDEGLSLAEILMFANQSKIKNKVIILDSCHSGVIGSHPISRITELTEGMTILTASTKDQYASEENGRGVFTTLLVDALTGAAGNLVGDVTPGSVYAHIDQSLGSWEQRPVFKTNVKSFVSLRKVQPSISMDDLRRIVEFFPKGGSEYQLDPSFEPEVTGRPPGAKPPDPANTAKFTILQRYNRIGLLVPIEAPHMWHAAMKRKRCKLTVLGEHYRRLVELGRI